MTFTEWLTELTKQQDRMNETALQPVEENIYQLDEQSRVSKNIDLLPTSLSQAMHELKRDKLMRDVLGEHLFEKYVDVKTKEWDEFRLQVTPWEIDTYLDTF